ncbi:MAG: hypothetical protein IKY39_05420 [Clostridia bacterium]|nr:hypothetical protein [Clostridia bacterium]
MKKTDHSAVDNLTAPERIIVNTGYQSSRFEYLKSSPEFKGIYDVASDILKTAFKRPVRNISQVSSESWYSALTGKSIYISYPASYSAKNFAGLLGEGRTEATFKNFSDIVIEENGTVYINDAGTFYKIETSAQDISAIIENVLNADTEDQSVINYSFDLNFDKEFGSQKTILAPMIPIYSDSVSAEVVYAENPVIKDDAFNQRTVNQILTAFSVNPNSTWRYTEADGTLVFVENTGILKISTNGVLTFTASDTGIKLPQQSSSSTYDNASQVALFVDTVNLSINQNAEMSITSPLTEDNAETFTFDYNVDGIPVKYQGNSAVKVRVRNGYITEYSQILRRYNPQNYMGATPLYIEALDNIIAKYQSSMNQINIKKMFPAYIDDLLGGEKSPDWYIEIDNIVAQ